MEGASPEPLSAASFARTLALIDAPEVVPPKGVGVVAMPKFLATYDLPKALRKESFHGRRWLGPGVWCADVELGDDSADRSYLLHARAGTKLPAHGHGGLELTLVLAGSFERGDSKYFAGDLAEEDEQSSHRPIVSSDEACLCLIASEKGMRPPSLLHRLMFSLVRAP